MYEINQKTIFVLDHTQYFSLSSENYIPLDFLKPNNSNEPCSSTSGQFSKSLWTCCVEATVEYCRIVWDLFPSGKLVRFIVSDAAAHIVNTWNHPTQNVSHVLNAMALVGIPPHVQGAQVNEFSVVHGLRAAIEALAEPTEQQAASLQLAREKANEPTESTAAATPPKILANKGRVICLTSTRNNASIKNLEEIFHNVLAQQNSLAATQKKFLPVEHCHLVIINIVPATVETLVTPRSRMDLSAILSTEVHTSSAADISNKLTHLIMSHYDLASTTVTGIPMKEEQNANSSANYDVEILHARNAHTIICGNEALLPTSVKEGVEYETVTLRWCTPRSSSDMQPCLAQHRVTPVDVTSRPSSCLINFLLNGRSVLLEMPRKSGGKTTSHLLSARGGEIFIHALQINRSCLEDPPAISDGPGGRVIDYRIADFAALIKAHRFVPLKAKLKPDDQLAKVRERLQRRSRYFPLTLGCSIVFNLQRNLTWLPIFLRKIMKEDMDKSDEVQCQQYVFELYKAASNGEQLPFSNISRNNRLKGSKKIDQYKLFCAELEVLVRSYSTTPHHQQILESIRNLRASFGDASYRIEGDADGGSVRSIIRATTDSPLSPPHSMEINANLFKTATKRSHSSFAQRTLLEIFTAAERSQANKRVDFTGRLCTPVGQIAKLYPNFVPKEKDSTGGGAAPAVAVAAAAAAVAASVLPAVKEETATSIKL